MNRRTWESTTWGTVGTLKYGKALRGYSDIGSTRVFGTNGPVGWTNDPALAHGPRPVVGRKGAYRGVHLATGPFWVIDTAYWLEPRPLLDPLWAYYKLLTVDINGMDSGSAIPSLTKAHFEAVPLELPSRDEQRRIARTLREIDELIESNDAAVKRLVALAQALAAGGDADRVVVSDVATLSRGLSYKGSGLVKPGADGALPMVNLANFTVHGWSNAKGLKYYSGPYRERHVLRPDDLVIANTDLTQRREILGRAVLVPPSLAASIHSHHTSVVRFARDPWLRVFLWAQTQDREFRERAMGFATGTTVAALPKEAVLDFAIHLPSNPERVAARVTALVAEAWSREEENAQLTHLRNELLPLLMSGAVRVSQGQGVA